MNLIDTHLPLTPRIVRAGEEAPIEWGGFRGECMLPAAATGGAFSLFAGEFSPENTALTRLQSREDEAFYIREGRVVFQLEDQTVTAGRGDCIFAPRGAAHSWRNTGDSPSRVAILLTPGGHLSAAAAVIVPGAAPLPKSSNVFPALAPAFIPAGSGVRIEAGSYRDQVMLNARQTAGLFTLFAREFMPGSHVPLHIHSREEETFYLLEGRLRLQIGDMVAEVGPGDCVFTPRHVVHGWECISDTAARAVALVTPGANFEGFFHAMGQRTLDPSNPAVLADLIALCARFGIEMLPPAIK